MPNPGDILFHKDFPFDNGTVKDKLFVVLSEADSEKPCLVLKTTSQSKRYPNCQKGCNPDKRVFFVPSTWQKCFDYDTYIQLPQIFEFSSLQLIEGSIAKEIRVLDALTPDCLVQLKSCLKKFKYDISPYHWKLIGIIR